MNREGVALAETDGAGVDERTQQLKGWTAGVRSMHIAHGIAAERCARLARVTGVLVAVLTAVVGTALFVSAAASQTTSVRYTAAGLSLLAATLGVAQVALNFPELAIRHQAAFVEYGKLRRDLDMIWMLGGASTVTADWLRDFRTGWSAAEAAAPVLPVRLRRTARRLIDLADSRDARNAKT